MQIKDKHGKEWKLVPVEPTTEMWIPSYQADINWPMRQQIYKDMLSAAPDPELPEGLEPVAEVRWKADRPDSILEVRIIDAVNFGDALILQSVALKALAEKDKEIAALSYLKNLADQYGLSIFADMEACEASNKAVESALKDVDYKGTYADGVLALKAEILEQCRINGMSAERELALKAKIERQEKLIKLCRGALQQEFDYQFLNYEGETAPWIGEALAAIEKETGA